MPVNVGPGLKIGLDPQTGISITFDPESLDANQITALKTKLGL
jgi:hypothetical protein